MESPKWIWLQHWPLALHRPSLVGQDAVPGKQLGVAEWNIVKCCAFGSLCTPPSVINSGFKCLNTKTSSVLDVWWLSGWAGTKSRRLPVVTIRRTSKSWTAESLAIEEGLKSTEWIYSTQHQVEKTWCISSLFRSSRYTRTIFNLSELSKFNLFGSGLNGSCVCAEDVSIAAHWNLFQVLGSEPNTKRLC